MAAWDPDSFNKAWNFASQAHNSQLLPGTTLPYINHVGNVTMEVMAALATSDGIRNPNLAIQCALLHDVIEDTDITRSRLELEFGKNVASGVLALTKNKQLPTKEAQMKDSLTRIQLQPFEVWMVKMADRITNLQHPPGHWSRDRIRRYRDEASLILDSLQASNAVLADRLKRKIELYAKYC